ncbi:MAG: hypothetical protein QOI41_2123 [Myxococcales bacterium]|nr:hypothetical protein [Myxococcales bacterium]
MSQRSTASSAVVVSFLFALVLAGCPADPTVEVPGTDGGDADVGQVGVDGSMVNGDSGNTADAAADAADAFVPPPCGRLTTLCGSGEKCSGSADCVSKICFGGTCQVPAPADGVKNGTETDVDCGGPMAPACADSKACIVKTDCASGVCTTSVCQAPSPTDMVQNGDETGVDCGGSKAPKCPVGGGCLTTADCDQVKCDLVQKKCLPASHTDGIENDGETDIDCGGTAPTKCPTGQGCVATSDCDLVLCDVGATNLCLPPSHTDGIKNGGETGTDCGGTAPTKCPTGQGCVATSDCDLVLCDVGGTKLCLPPTHTDGIKNAGETGTDCGGAALPLKCPVGEGCAATTDCTNTLCNAGTLVCDPPSKTDKIKNGTETDVDCGGGAPTNAPGCAEGGACTADTDCALPFCNASKCVAGRSCKTATTSGIVTCGRRETGDVTPEAKQESCCRSLPLPTTTTVKLDKYEVTAGRMRQFIDAVGPNLRSWAKTEITNSTAVGLRLKNDLVVSATVDMTDMLPASATPGEPLNMLQQIGATVMDSRTPSTSQGCFNGTSAFGANTYYWDGATLRAHFAGHVDRRFTQAQYDEKPMNCGAYWMYAAFCAWDGGRMPTEAEMNEAWGTANYPWGTATFTFPLDNAHQGPYGWEATANYFNKNNFFFYHFPDYGDGADEAGYIAAPGRFILDKTTNVSANGESWLDLGANVMEMARYRAGNNTFCDFSITNAPGDVTTTACKDTDTGALGVIRKTGLPSSAWVGGSWEGHQQFSVSASAEPFFKRASYVEPVQTQYGKTGVRCAR